MSQSPDSKYYLKRDDGSVVELPDKRSATSSSPDDSPKDDDSPSPGSLSSHSTPFGSMKCECHHVNWTDPLNNGGFCQYTFSDGSYHEQGIPHPKYGMPCGDKSNLDLVSVKEVSQVCKYQLRGSNFALSRDIQEDLIWYLCRIGHTGSYDERFDETHPKHYKKHYNGVREMVEEKDRQLEEDYYKWLESRASSNFSLD
jgi:hypothetical protein